MKVKSNKNGYCPLCNSTNLDYDNIEIEGEAVYYPYKCKDCGTEGEEWHLLNFIGHSVYDEEEGAMVEIEDYMIKGE